MIDKTLRTGVTLAAAVFALASAGFASAAVKAPLPRSRSTLSGRRRLQRLHALRRSLTGGAVLTCIPASTTPGAPTGCVRDDQPRVARQRRRHRETSTSTGCQSAST